MEEITKTAETTETTPTVVDEIVATKPTKKKKVKRSVPVGQVHILATFNNTIVTFTDNKGGALATASAGGCGFRGSKKGTAYAAQVAMEKAGHSARPQYGLSKVEVYVRGVGLGRESAIRTLQRLDM